MKGVSAVIATILMLMITIALAGTAYMYISGVFSARTAVVMAISDSECNASHIKVFVRNDGTTASSAISFYMDGTSWTCNPSLSSISAGDEDSCALIRGVGHSSGYHSLRAETTGSSARGSTYCGATGIAA